MSTKQHREAMKVAQANFRKRHAKRLSRIRVVVNILQRRSDRVGVRDIEKLATALRRLLGADAAVVLRAALRPRR
jgi:hypothetical protein